MRGGSNGKRSGGGGGDSRRKKRQRYKQYSSTSSRRELTNGSRGFLISCTPRHEVQCFRDALILLDKHIDIDALTAKQPTEAQDATPNVPVASDASTKDAAPSDSAPPADGSVPAESAVRVEDATPVGTESGAPAAADKPADKVGGGGLAASLAEELASLKAPKPTLFERLDLSVNGSIFVAVRDARVDLEGVAESVLNAARESGEPGCRHCIKIMPIHTSCYANAKDAAAAAVRVAEKHFPAGEATYAIAFKSRFNSGAHRDDYITAAADAIKERFGTRYSVNLTTPDVVLIVEVLKTSCCIGSFLRYFDLAKMNIREATKPRKEKPVKEKVTVEKDASGGNGKEEAGGDKDGETGGKKEDKTVVSDSKEEPKPAEQQNKEVEAPVLVLKEEKPASDSNTATADVQKEDVALNGQGEDAKVNETAAEPKEVKAETDKPEEKGEDGKEVV